MFAGPELARFARLLSLGFHGRGWARPFRAIATGRTRAEKRLQELVDRSGT